MLRILMEENNKASETLLKQINEKMDSNSETLKKQMKIDNENLLKQNNEELKEIIQQQINGVNNKLDQQKAEVELILKNYEEGNVRQFAEVKLNMETMENRLDNIETKQQSLKEEVEEKLGENK